MLAPAIRNAAVAILVLATVGLARTQACGSKPLVVTAGKPAELTRESLRGLSLDRELILHVMRYEPAARGTVAVVVSLRGTDAGQARELGRFGIFPDAPFEADQPEAAMRFRIPLSQEDVTRLADPRASLVISLEPAGGAGEGARVELRASDRM